MLRLPKHTIQIASILPCDYRVVMITKNEKQSTFFSNLGNIHYCEARYTANNAKQENSFYKLSSGTFYNTPITETHETLANREGALRPNKLHKTSAQHNKQLRGSYTTATVEPTQLNVYLNLTNNAFTLLFTLPIASYKTRAS